MFSPDDLQFTMNVEPALNTKALSAEFDDLLSTSKAKGAQISDAMTAGMSGIGKAALDDLNKSLSTGVEMPTIPSPLLPAPPTRPTMATPGGQPAGGSGRIGFQGTQEMEIRPHLDVAAVEAEMNRLRSIAARQGNEIGDLLSAGMSVAGKGAMERLAEEQKRQAEKARIDGMFKNLGKDVGEGEEASKMGVTLEELRAIKEEEDKIHDAIDIQGEARKEALTQLMSQEEQLERIKALSDPSLIKQQVAQQLLVDAATKELADLKQKEMEAQTGITEQTRRHREELERIKAMSDPEAIKRQVEQERELAKARKEYNEALAKETREQERPGFFQKMLQNPKGMMGDMLKNVGGLFGGVKEEYKKGGVGGLLDAGMSAVKGGGGGGGASGIMGAIVGGAEGGGLGAAAGAMAGGPTTMMVTAALEGIKVAGKAAALPLKAVTSGLEMLSGGLRGLQGDLGPIGVGFDLASGAMEKLSGAVKSIPVLGDLLGPFLDQLTMVPGIIKDITSSLVSMAGKASPGQINLFQRAIEDVQGVIGQTFLPVLTLLRDGVRFVGDALANLLPNTNEIHGALAELRAGLADFGGALRDVISELGPMIRTTLIISLRGLGTVLGLVAHSAAAMARGFMLLISPFTTLGNIVTGLLGITGDANRTSVGAAARPASFQGFEQYQQQIQTSAYAEPGGTSMQQVPSLIVRIGEMLGQLLASVNRFSLEGLQAMLTELIARFIPNVPAPADVVNNVIENDPVLMFLRNLNPNNW